MKRILIIAILATAISSLALAQTTDKKAAPSSKAEQEVVKVSDELIEALGRTDIAALDRLHADDCIITQSSPLDEINETTIARLGLLWTRELGTTSGLEATPLVVDGAIFTTGSWSVVYAIDAATGQIRWTYDPGVDRARAKIHCCDAVNRGVAFYRGKVFVGSLDGRLLALDAATGNRVWETITVDKAKPYSITGAPRIARGMALIGNAGAEMGVLGQINFAHPASAKQRDDAVMADPLAD